MSGWCKDAPYNIQLMWYKDDIVRGKRQEHIRDEKADSEEENKVTEF